MLAEGQIVKVKVLGTDEKGRIKLSMKALVERPEGMPEPERRERTERSDRGDRGDRQPRGERAPRQYAERNEQSDAAPTAAQDDQPQA